MTAKVEAQVLAQVGDASITQAQLQSAIASSPFGTNFPALEAEQQARLRGNMLTRLVQAELFRQEALHRGISKRTDFRHEVMNFRSGLLYKRYIESIRDESMNIPDDVKQDLKKKYRSNANELDAARSAYISDKFKNEKVNRFHELAKKYHLKTWPDRLKNADDDTLLAQADGFTVHYRDIRIPAENRASKSDTPALQQERLDDFIEILLAARAALDAGINVDEEVRQYENLLLPQILVEQKEKEWVPDRSALRDYFQKHPDIGSVNERRHIIQIVLKSQDHAEAVRQRILRGESIHKLASDLSIDPVGRKNAGDMGWLDQGSGFPEVEKALDGLADKQISSVVQTERGYHLVMIEARQPARRRSLAQIEDRVRQALISEKMTSYIKTLLKRYPVKWNPEDSQASNQTMKN
jgi:peptidyl-prolyl cis-trans isomerase C